MLAGQKKTNLVTSFFFIFLVSYSQSLALQKSESVKATTSVEIHSGIPPVPAATIRPAPTELEPFSVPLKITQNSCSQDCVSQANSCNSPCFSQAPSPGRKRCHQSCKSRFDRCQSGCQNQSNIDSKKYKNSIPVIDVHVHINDLITQSLEKKRGLDFSKAADRAIKLMDKYKVQTSIIMVPPARAPSVMLGRINVQSLLEQANRYPERFMVLGGGGSLNPMIQRTPPDQVTEDIKRIFERKAESLIQEGVVGFGEMAALHFSFHKNHPSENTLPDHPLFLLLADIAARHNVPIDLHNEVVSRSIKVPILLRKRNKKNPSRVSENITGLERLLAHNRGAKIILSHSSDATGHRTAKTIRRLMERHSNLMMSLNVLPEFPFQKNLPLKTSGGIKKDWVQLIRDYPDRFLIGSDQFYNNPCPKCRSVDFVGPSMRWLQLLPPDIATKIAIENPRRIFKRKPKRIAVMEPTGKYLSEKDIIKKLVGKTLKLQWMNGDDLELTYEQGGSLSILNSRLHGRTIHKRWWVSKNEALCITLGPHDMEHCAKVKYGNSPKILTFESSNGQHLYDGTLLN